MAYKNLLVVLDADQSSRERIAYAAALAARFEAHLVGLYVSVSSLTRDQYALDRGGTSACGLRAVFNNCPSRLAYHRGT